MCEFPCLLLEISIQLLFFPFLLFIYCCSQDPCVVCVVSGCCILSLFFFTLSSCRRIYALFNSCKSSFSSLDTYSLSMSSLRCNAFMSIFARFSHQQTLRVVHSSLNDNNFPQVSNPPVGWGCGIRWLYICKGVRLPQRGATCLPKVATRKTLGRDPGCWAVINPVTEWSMFVTHRFGSYLLWRSIGWARSDQLTGHAKP